MAAPLAAWPKLSRPSTATLDTWSKVPFSSKPAAKISVLVVLPDHKLYQAIVLSVPTLVPNLDIVLPAKPLMPSPISAFTVSPVLISIDFSALTTGLFPLPNKPKKFLFSVSMLLLTLSATAVGSPYTPVPVVTNLPLASYSCPVPCTFTKSSVATFGPPPPLPRKLLPILDNKPATIAVIAAPAA